MTVPFLDLKLQLASIRPEIDRAIADVLDNTAFILGKHVTGFEERFAAAHDAQHCIAVNNGTSALHLALWAAGIGPDDEVIVPVNTFIATAEAVMLCGARPVFVDHDEHFNLDPTLVRRAIGPRTKAIMPVHLYGQPARMEEIAAIANEYDLLIFEDAAQAHLARLNGKPVGSWGLATCFSFYPGKNLGACGEGGAVITNDARYAERLRLLRDHGAKEKYNHLLSGHNYRMEAIQGAVLGVKLPYLQAWTDARRGHAALYSELLAGVAEVKTPSVLHGAEPVWHLYVIEVERRDALVKWLAECDIATGLHYPIPLNRQPAFQELSMDEAYPMSDAAAERILSLPMFPELTRSQIAHVCESVRKFYSA